MSRVGTDILGKIVLLSILSLLAASCRAGQLSMVLTSRTIPIDENAWAGSSINVLAGVSQMIYTDGVYQYAGYYNADARLVLAKRRIGEDTWHKNVTVFSTNVNDAHNTVSLIVDGDGYLHVSWGQHNSELNYARGVEPGSLVVEIAPMLGANEHSVTYPQFYRLPTGNLIFQYRDGGSGKGSMIMNAYSTKTGQWRRLHTGLLDGEGRRSAYWTMTVDGSGVLHLAWTWRETPDVASNHDLYYLQSRDEGSSWQSPDGGKYQLPITENNIRAIVHIGQNHKLMNPPIVAADDKSHPFITTYWADSPGARPRYRMVFNLGRGWREIAAPPARENFELRGTGTRKPPYSRAALLVESDWQDSWFHLVYRDDFEKAIVVMTVRDLEKPVWSKRLLADADMGAWEPTIDPVQWNRLKQAHMYFQKVQQIDGDDSHAADVGPGPLDLLIWSPDWERHQNLKPVAGEVSAADQDRPLSQAQIGDIATRTALWQWKNMPTGWAYGSTSWTMAPFYIGNLLADSIAPAGGLEKRVLAAAEQADWQPAERIYDADDHCVMQAWLRLYMKYGDPGMIDPSRRRLEAILDDPPDVELDWGTPRARDRWSWSDALFMGPMSWLLMYRATDDSRYLDYMNREWWATADRLYDSRTGLYFRDESYLDIRERNGRTIHWARGTGWSFAGLAQVLEYFPKNHPDYPRYVRQFSEMAAAFRAAQQDDGLWRPGLLDPQTHVAKETSGSAFAVFGLAWGINHGLLDREDYQPSVTRGWNALSDCVTDAGKLEHVQPIGAAPYGFDPENSEPFATGAFLMAASEVYKLAGNE